MKSWLWEGAFTAEQLCAAAVRGALARSGTFPLGLRVSSSEADEALSARDPAPDVSFPLHVGKGARGFLWGYSNL